MPIEKLEKVQESIISLELSDAGVKRITILADNAKEQGGAHFVLAAVSAEIRALDDALKSLSGGRK